MPIRLNSAEEREYLILRALWELEEPYFEKDLRRAICRVQRRDLPANGVLQLTEIFSPEHQQDHSSFSSHLHELEEFGLITYDLGLTFEGETYLGNLNRIRLGITSYTQFSCP